MNSTIPQRPAGRVPVLPRPADPDYRATDAERHHWIALYDLERAVRGVLDAASPEITGAERTAVLCGALVSRALDALGWCAACQADSEGLCKDHHAAVEMAEASLRLAYRRLPGRPLIDIDL